MIRYHFHYAVSTPDPIEDNVIFGWGRVNEGSAIYVLSKSVLFWLNDLLVVCFLYNTSICF